MSRGILLACMLACAPVAAADEPISTLVAELAEIDARTDGVVGACADVHGKLHCVNGDRRFSMQSVMKLLVAAAVMDAIDTRDWRLDDPVTLRRADLSVYVQPIAKLVGPEGYRTTVGDLVERAVVDSDSAATDVLLARLGGPRAVQRFLERKGIRGVRIDRNERDLQSEIAGLRWQPEYVDPARFASAIAAVPEHKRRAAHERYRRDPRDTATPRGMTAFLRALAAGCMLSRRSTEHLLAVMSRTRTFPDRLRAGAPAGWSVAHKTGSSGEWRGLSVATNDVGVLTAPDGATIPIAVFVGSSRASAADRSKAIAATAHAVVARHQISCLGERRC